MAPRARGSATRPPRWTGAASLVPVPADPDGLAPLGAAYAPELATLGLRPVGEALATERRVIATAAAENALVLALDEFLQNREDEIRRRLAAERRR